MCEACDYCEFDSCPPSFVDLLRYKAKQWKRHVIKWTCKVKGHKFEDHKTYKEYNLLLQYCERCGTSNILHADDRSPLSEEESFKGYGALIWIMLNEEVPIWDLLPKQPWVRNSTDE